MIKKIKMTMSVLLGSTMLLSSIPTIPAVEVNAASICEIDIDTEYQTIDGFGGMNHPEWTGKDLTDAQRQKVFGNGNDELGFSIVRIFVNPDSNQWSKAVPTAKYATEHGVTVFASPWEPPANLAESGGSNGKLHLPKSNYAAYAEHLNNFGSYMKNQGVDLYAVSVQNEPDYASEWTVWSTDETTDFLANYADKITSTRVMSPESFQYAPENASWVPDGGKKYYTKILNNSKAFANCDLFGTHFYGTQRAWMDFPALESCGKPIWMTEVYTDSKNDADVWPMALDVSENIHNGLVVGNMSAYVWWYIRRSYGPLKEDGTISKRGYCMAQYSKFVRPGDVRISATEQPTSDVYISAYKNDDGQVTIVALNKSDSEYNQVFDVGQNITDVDRYRTSANENLAATLNMNYSGGSFNAQLPAKSVSTFVVTLDGGAVIVEPDENGYYFHDTYEGDTFNWNGHGASDVALSGHTPYQGGEALLVQNREKSWNGAEKALSTKAFKAGEEYSFSVCAAYLDGEDTQTMKLSLQYTDASGETKYANIASAKAVKGQYVQLANQNFKLPENGKDFIIYVETESSTDNFYIDEAIGAVAGTVIEGPAEPVSIKGDVNADGKFDITDVVLLQRWILAVPDTKLADWKAGDLCEDDRLDVFDLCLMKRLLIEKETHITPDAYMAQVASNIVEFEANGATDEKSGTEYGTYEKVTFTSAVCGGRSKSFNVLLPANYDKNKKYPVLYTLHGYWGDEDALLDKGDASLKLRQIIGNAIAAGESEKMIVVFPDIYASDTQDKCDGLNDKNNKAYDNFINELTKEIMPYMEQHYSIKTGRDNTAITGFSMGGRESLYIGFSRPDLFGYVGAMCPAPGLTTDLIKENDLKFGSTSPYLLMVSAGSNDQIVWSTPSGYHDTMNKNSVTHVWHYVTDGDHGGKTIRPHMYNFIRYIFKA